MSHQIRGRFYCSARKIETSPGPVGKNRSVPGTITVILLLCLGTTGCLRRSLTIRTDPPGALVYVNDTIQGESPVTYDFLWYGWHRVMIRKEGFARVEDRRELRAPPHLWIPFDLIAEVWPWTIRDDREWTYTLEPMETLPTPMPPSLFQSQE